MHLLESQFWLGLGAIAGVNLVLSGDNAVVIALGARSLPVRQQRQVIMWGTAVAAVLRVMLTIVAVKLLTLPYLKLIGGALLLWIAVEQLAPCGDARHAACSSSNVSSAIKTVMVADLVMSLDNVLAVAAVAKGDIVLLVLGLLISVPLIAFGTTMLTRLMQRYPLIITVGVALIGYVAAEMLVTDPVVIRSFGTQAVFHQSELSVWGLAGAAFVATTRKWLRTRNRPDHT